jgi:hypothetical protein
VKRTCWSWRSSIWPFGEASFCSRPLIVTNDRSLTIHAIQPFWLLKRKALEEPPSNYVTPCQKKQDRHQGDRRLGNREERDAGKHFLPTISSDQRQLCGRTTEWSGLMTALRTSDDLIIINKHAVMKQFICVFMFGPLQQCNVNVEDACITLTMSSWLDLRVVGGFQLFRISLVDEIISFQGSFRQGYT